MRPSPSSWFLTVAAIVLLAFWSGGWAAAATVTLLPTPNGGLQPQAVVDRQGVLHLLYFKGDPAHGDLFYVHKPLRGAVPFSAPLRVNSIPHTAIAIGAIRGGQLALGRAGRIFVVWNGSEQAPKVGDGRTPLLYTRLNRNGTSFEPERNLITWAYGLDGGCSVAADQQGRVFVTWHASLQGVDEAHGGVFLTRSEDDGLTFNREPEISKPQMGQCGCCAMRAFCTDSGRLSVLYRDAVDNIHRGTVLLSSDDHGQTFQASALQNWDAATCPMSSFSFTEEHGILLGAWETRGNVYYESLGAAGLKRTPIAPPGLGQRKYPAIAMNSQGLTLLAWSDGSGWERGGSLVWQVFDAQGKPIAPQGRLNNGVPMWSFPATVACPDGNFLLIH